MLDTVRQALRFATGLRRFLRNPSPPGALEQMFREDSARAPEQFLDSADALVWSIPASPYRPLLEQARVERDGLQKMVRSDGLPRALEHLRDAGVYITYEEFLGQEPIRRGSVELEVEPASFFNSTLAADYFGSTSGTRSAGTPVAVSFEDKRSRSLIGPARGLPRTAPLAVWLPCLPSAAGLGVVLSCSGEGQAPKRWFSQIPTSMDGIPFAKRLTNTMLPTLGRLAGTPLPRPEHAPTSAPEPILAWCRDALSREDMVCLVTYPSSAVSLANLACERGVRLDGLLVSLLGEPATVGRRRAIERTGATTAATYAFMQTGGVGGSCPNETEERYHLDEGRVAVVGRERKMSDGSLVDAFLWTTMLPTARSFFINVENDDYGTISRDATPCSCLYGQLGSRTCVADVRGMSKVVAGGITVPGAALGVLVDQVLPSELGGTPVDYQFAELDTDDQGVLVLRINPAVGRIDEAAAMAVVVRELNKNEIGRLATAVWTPGGSIQIRREAPRPAASGKLLPFEPLARAGPRS